MLLCINMYVCCYHDNYQLIKYTHMTIIVRTQKASVGIDSCPEIIMTSLREIV